MQGLEEGEEESRSETNVAHDWFGSSLFKSLFPFVFSFYPCVSSFIVNVLTSYGVLNYQLMCHLEEESQYVKKRLFSQVCPH